MIRKFAAVAVVATASLSFAAAALAEDFPAAPMNPGPAKVTGLGPIGDIANIALTPVNVIAVPLLVPQGVTPVAAPMVVRHHRRHRRMRKIK